MNGGGRPTTSHEQTAKVHAVFFIFSDLWYNIEQIKAVWWLLHHRRNGRLAYSENVR